MPVDIGRFAAYWQDHATGEYIRLETENCREVLEEDVIKTSGFADDPSVQCLRPPSDLEIDYFHDEVEGGQKYLMFVFEHCLQWYGDAEGI